MPTFQKILFFPKMAAIFNLRILAKNLKTKNAYISLPIRDRVILSKFSSDRVSEEFAILKKKSSFQKWTPF